MVPGWKMESSEDEILVIAYDKSDPMDFDGWTDGVGVRDGSQYISVMVEAIDDEDAAVL